MGRFAPVLSPGGLYRFTGLYHLIFGSNQRTYMVILSEIVRARGDQGLSEE
jgi:hypothetical protein